MDHSVNTEIEGEEDFASMLEESFTKSEKTQNIKTGVIVEIQAEDERVLISTGEKLEGIVNISEIQNENGELIFNVGDEIPVMVTGYYNERPKLSYKKVKEQESTINFIKEHKDNFEDMVIECRVVKENRGGYVVAMDDLAFFMPKSLSAFRDGDKVIDRKIKVKIIKLDPDDNSMVVSRRKLLGEERKKRKELIDSLFEEDKIIDGVVKKITSYGMFVDVGGIDGLVHYNEISYKGPVNPSKYYKEGDEVEVKALSYDKEKRHLSLSVKGVHSDPWEEVETELDEGDTIEVTVSNIEPYGAFVDLGNDIEGFLHISEITWDKNIKHPKDYLEQGALINVEVIEIDSVKHKLRVSLKTLLPKPFDGFSKKYNEGDVTKGVVTTLTDFGAFLRIGGIEGLLHNQDSSWNKGVKCKETFKIGEEIEVKIIKINMENEKISLSKKALLESPIEAFANENRVNDIVKGTVRDVKDFGVFVSLTDAVDALIRLEDLGPILVDEIKKGQEIEGVIVQMDVRRDRIRLSVKKLDHIHDQAMMKKINSEDTKSTFGDLLKEQLN
jgi:small subunit ribosomal protein S1